LKVFTDSNFLISAFATRGLSAELLETLLESVEITISQKVEGEVLEKMSRKFKLPQTALDEVASFLVSFHKVPTPEDIPYKLRDPDDEEILAAAISAKCDYFVTGDKDLLVEKESIKSIQIVSPRELWMILKS
jgi:putative PIN family toxin of toxin-antitoxin system